MSAIDIVAFVSFVVGADLGIALGWRIGRGRRVPTPPLSHSERILAPAKRIGPAAPWNYLNEAHRVLENERRLELSDSARVEAEQRAARIVGKASAGAKGAR